MRPEGFKFQLHELVCKHVLKKYGERAWMFIDQRAIDVLHWLREGIGRPIQINTYGFGGTDTQSGLRCNLCKLVQNKTKAQNPYLSAHVLGKAWDLSVKDMTADEVRSLIVEHIASCPHPIRLELEVAWVHIDVYDTGSKIGYFRP